MVCEIGKKLKMNIQTHEFVPCKPLQPFVEFFWRGEFNINGDGMLRQKVLPNGYVELVVHLSDLHCHLFKNSLWNPSPAYTLIGLHSHPYQVQFSDYVRVFGIRFKPESFSDIFGVPAAEFGDTFDDVSSVLGQSFHIYCEQLRHTESLSEMLALTEQYLLWQLERQHFHEESYINKAAEIIRQSKGFIRIEELAKQVYVSSRQLERSFKQKVGVSPKFYMRIARLNEAHRLLENNPSLKLTHLSYECGYADQAHFIRDFNTLTGIRPKHFVKNREAFIVNPHLAKSG